MTAFEERPHSPYFGSADATQLYVVLLDEYERWSGDTKLVRELEFEARAALNWIDEYADLQGNGYVSYQTAQRGDRTREPVLEGLAGLDLVPRRDAAGLPACDVRVAGLRLRRQGAWRPPGARVLARRRSSPTSSNARPPTSSAASTATSGSRDGEYFAVALDADGRQVDSLTSNIGHLLWSGIVDKSKAKAVARHLMGERLFSGWGVRTLAEGEGRYNPIGYHVGTVWPFDNAFIAWGLRRYGFKDEAARIAAGILDAAEFFEGRLPEAFGGYPRDDDQVPGPVPDRLQPAGVVDRNPAAAARGDARAAAGRASTSSSIPRYRRRSVASNCSTSRAGGAASTPSDVAGSIPRVRREGSDRTRSIEAAVHSGGGACADATGMSPITVPYSMPWTQPHRERCGSRRSGAIR